MATGFAIGNFILIKLFSNSRAGLEDLLEKAEEERRQVSGDSENFKNRCTEKESEEAGRQYNISNTLVFSLLLVETSGTHLAVAVKRDYSLWL